MSSEYVVDKILNFLDTNYPTEKVVEFDAEFRDLRELLADNAIGRGDNWLGIQFIGSEETPITVPATNTQGKYREIGAIYIHIIAPAVVGAGSNIRARSTTLRNLFRGRNIDGIIIEGITPPNFAASGTLQFEGGWTAASLLLSYEYDIDL